MRYHTLRGTSCAVSQLALGCWSFGGDADSYWGEQSQEVADAIVSEAIERGVNFFDTAFIYNDGASETSLGQTLRGRRDKALICNKVPILSFEELPDYEAQIAQSLRRLQTDAVDMLMLHWPTSDEALLRANLEALLGAQKKGMAKMVGVSNFGPGTLAIAEEMGVPVLLDELVYNLMSRGIEGGIMPYCQARGIGVAVYMPLMQGILTGKYGTLADIPPLRTRTIQFDSRQNPLARHGGHGAPEEVESLLTSLRAIAAGAGVPAGRLALAWLAAKPGVYTVIAGCRTVEQLRENIAGVELTLTPDVMAALDAASAPLYAKLGDNADLWQLGEQSRVW